MITAECPDCWLVQTPAQCETCDGRGYMIVYCARCLQRPAVAYQDGEATYSDCTVVAECRGCEEVWCRDEVGMIPDPSDRSTWCCDEMLLLIKEVVPDGMAVKDRPDPGPTTHTESHTVGPGKVPR